MRLTIVGTGYVGLVAGTCFAETGNEVLCLDIDRRKIARLRRGQVTIYEPGLDELCRRNQREERLRFTTSYDEAAAHGRVHFLCLPTPPLGDGSADVRYVLSAVRELARRLDPRDATPVLFVLKSTVPVGTDKLVRAEVRKSYKGRFAVAHNPEFLKEGAAVEDFLRPDRVVVGAREDWAYQTLRALHEPFCRTGAPILRMSPESAALTKYAANCMLAAKISFMNEVARVCEACGADVEEVRRGISLDPRVGKAFLFAGLGYGGSCFPKDTRALAATARALGLQAFMCEAAEQVNEGQKIAFLPAILKHLGPKPRGKRVAVWGLAFKPRTDDIREAPALALVDELLKRGIRVQAFDPEAMDNVRRLRRRNILLAPDPYAALAGAEALVLVTEWNEFRSPDWARVKKLLRRPAVFDGRNIYDPALLRRLGFEYQGVGRR